MINLPKGVTICRALVTLHILFFYIILLFGFLFTTILYSLHFVINQTHIYLALVVYGNHHISDDSSMLFQDTPKSNSWCIKQDLSFWKLSLQTSDHWNFTLFHGDLSKGLVCWRNLRQSNGSSSPPNPRSCRS